MKFSAVAVVLTVLLTADLLLVEATSVDSAELSSEQQLSSRRNNTGKFVSLFTVVRFSNSQCTANTNYSGTCMTSEECSAEGGTGSGSCASGFGVCCVFILKSCGSMSSRNCTYITNPSSLSLSQTCTYVIKKCSSDVCQIRLDYYSLAIAAPNDANSVCENDKFIVTGASSTAPTICGQSNAGQHMYLDVATANYITLNFLLSATSTTNRAWSIKATQIPCNSLVQAPANCLQYYTAVSGTIMSFNFDSSSSAVSRKHLANQDQSICFRMEQNYCSICYSTCSTTNVPAAAAFSISGPAGMSAIEAANCLSDYVLIPGGYNQGTSPIEAADRICGGFWSAASAATASVTVCTSRKPFRFQFVTDGGLTATTDPETNVETGFCLTYTQVPC